MVCAGDGVQSSWYIVHSSWFPPYDGGSAALVNLVNMDNMVKRSLALPFDYTQGKLPPLRTSLEFGFFLPEAPDRKASELTSRVNCKASASIIRATCTFDAKKSLNIDS